MEITRILEITLSIILLLLFPFLFVGIINRVKSFWAGRKGPRLLQPLYDFIKLFKKGEVISKTTSFVFRISPVIIFSSILTAGLFVPIINNRSVFGFDGDFILFGYLFAISRFFSIISAMDTGSSFEGMGASREVTFSALAEPAFFMIISSMCLISGNTSFEKIFADIFSLIHHSVWISFNII
jgi:formate hydrogenlyase subunit 4